MIVLVVGENEGINSMSMGGSTRLMKVIDLQEAKANLEQYAVECQTSPSVYHPYRLLMRRAITTYLENSLRQAPRSVRSCCAD